jgi:hypothetical protein
MLVVTAFELGDPLMLGILVQADDSPAHLERHLLERPVENPAVPKISVTGMPASPRSKSPMFCSSESLLFLIVRASLGWRTPATSGWYGWQGQIQSRVQRSRPSVS